MRTPDGFSTPARKGRMNRSRMIAAGTSVGALIAITAGVAAANPAPETKTKANPEPRTDQRSDDGGSQGQTGDQGFDQGDDDGWRQLPPDTSATDPGFSGGTDNGGSDFNQPPPFDPGQSSGSSNTSSGGS